MRDDDLARRQAADELTRMDQEMFWTPEWQAGDAEIEAEKAAGRTTRYLSDEDFLASFGTQGEAV